MRSLRLSFKRKTKKFHNLKTILNLKKMKSANSNIKKKKKCQKMKSFQLIIASYYNHKIKIVKDGYLVHMDILRIEKPTRFKVIT